MTLPEFKAYLDALIDETGDERLKRVRAKADEIQAVQPLFTHPQIPPDTYPYPDTGVAPWFGPYTTCGAA